ncbi:MAG: response regulator [Verrucomicrobia bacterium]|nr:response regulator [Verrucomicrobiota bacterium]
MIPKHLTLPSRKRVYNAVRDSVKISRATILTIAGLFLVPGRGNVRAEYAPRFYKLDGVPSEAGAARTSWAQLPNGAWATRTFAGIYEQGAIRWSKRSPPPEIIVQLASFKGGLLAASTKRCWLARGSDWIPIPTEADMRSILGDDSQAFLSSNGSICCITEDGHVRRVFEHPAKASLILQRYGTTISAFEQDLGGVWTWNGTTFLKSAESRSAVELANSCLMRGPAANDSFFFDGAKTWPKSAAFPPGALISDKSSHDWGQVRDALVPGSWGAVLRNYSYFPTSSGVIAYSRINKTQRLLPSPPDDQVLQNLQPTEDGLLASGQHGFYLLPDPGYMQAAKIPGVAYDIIYTHRGIILLTTNGQFFLDGTDAGLNLPAVLGMLELKSGELVTAESGHLTWGKRQFPLPQLKTGQVVMAEVSPDRLAMVQWFGPPELNDVLLLDRDGRIRHVSPPFPPNCVVPLKHSKGFLVYTRSGVFRYNADGEVLSTFGHGYCWATIEDGEFSVMDSNGDFYDETGRLLCNLPFSSLQSAIHWRNDFYVLGRTRQGLRVAARFDPKTGVMEPLDIPGSSTPIEIRVQDDNLVAICEGEVLRFSEPRFIRQPEIRLDFKQADGSALPESGLSAGQSLVRLTLPAPRLWPWQSPTYSLKVGDSPWEPVEAGSTVVLPRLSYGDNDVQVRASVAGLERAVRHVIHRARPWWLSWPGALLGTLAVSGSFFGLLRWRTRILHQRNLELTRIVDSRTEQLRKANAFKDEFLARMNHEIRNPMNGVIGVARIVAARARDKRDDLLADSLSACAEQLRATVDEVLDLSRIEEGKISLNEEDFEIVELVRTTCRRFDRDEGLFRLVSPVPDAHSCHGDQGKIRLVLGNFLSNARKYGSPARADISLSIESPGPEKINLTVRVTSPGPTLTPEELDRCFLPFGRGRQAADTGAEGSGIGLGLCRQYMKLMGGDVGAESADGQTTFWFRVPLQRSDAPLTRQNVLLPNLRVLAIEDERYNRLVLGYYMGELDFHVDWASNFTESFALLEQETYDVIITDWSLPDMSGSEALKQMRDRLGKSCPPIIVISASATTESRKQILAAGATDFISKPVSQTRLCTVLAKLNLTPPPSGKSDGLDQTEPDSESAGPEFGRLLMVGPADEVLPRFLRDLETAFEAAKTAVAQGSPESTARLHAVHNLGLLVQARGLEKLLDMLETAVGQGRPKDQLEQILGRVADEIAQLRLVIVQRCSAPANPPDSTPRHRP